MTRVLKSKIYVSETVLFSGCLLGIICLLLSRQALIMQRPLVQQPNLEESLKYIHPNNPYLVTLYTYILVIGVFQGIFQRELLEAEKQVEGTIKEYQHMLVFI